MSRSTDHCTTGEWKIAAFLDGALPQEENWSVSKHLQECGNCEAEARQIRILRARLRAAPRREPPADLKSALQVLASRERVRNAARYSWASRRAAFWQDFRLWRDNLMRPFALPVTGGLFTAVILFAILVPAFRPQIVQASQDTPIGVNTEAGVKRTAPIALDYDNVTVDITIDEQGRMVDYSIPRDLLNDPNLRRSIENNLIFMQFTPATRFGMPTVCKLRVSFRRSRIDVKG